MTRHEYHREYTVSMDGGIELAVRCRIPYGPDVKDADCGDTSRVEIPGKVVGISAPADADPETIMKAQRIAAAFRLGEITWIDNIPDDDVVLQFTGRGVW